MPRRRPSRPFGTRSRGDGSRRDGWSYQRTAPTKRPASDASDRLPSETRKVGVPCQGAHWWPWPFVRTNGGPAWQPRWRKNAARLHSAGSPCYGAGGGTSAGSLMIGWIEAPAFRFSRGPVRMDEACRSASNPLWIGRGPTEVVAIPNIATMPLNPSSDSVRSSRYEPAGVPPARRPPHGQEPRPSPCRVSSSSVWVSAPPRAARVHRVARAA
jgi:hypothetical protein